MSFDKIRDTAIQAAIEASSKAIKDRLSNVEVYRVSCLSCVHFNELTEQCLLYKQRPPARIIAKGCDSYMDDLEVPY